MVALGVRAAIRGVVRKWEDVQVELHGSYSCARFKEMNKYSRSSGLLRALFVLVMTPVPVILLVAVVDALPLQPIELGLMHSGTLWLRGTLMTLFESFSILLVLRYDVAHLGISHRAMTFTSVATSLLNNAFGLGISALLWYALDGVDVDRFAHSFCMAFHEESHSTEFQAGPTSSSLFIRRDEPALYGHCV
jgi:hypothetical protein